MLYRHTAARKEPDECKKEDRKTISPLAPEVRIDVGMAAAHSESKIHLLGLLRKKNKKAEDHTAAAEAAVPEMLPCSISSTFGLQTSSEIVRTDPQSAAMSMLE